MKHFSPRQKALLRAIRDCYAIAPACDRVGVGRSTFYRWEQDEEFAKAVEQAREDCVSDVEARHVEAAKGKCVISRIHFLKSKRREVYGDQGRLEVEHKQLNQFNGKPPQGSAELAVKGLQILQAILAGGGVAGRIEKPEPLNVTPAPDATPDT